MWYDPAGLGTHCKHSAFGYRILDLLEFGTRFLIRVRHLVHPGAAPEGRLTRADVGT